MTWFNKLLIIIYNERCRDKAWKPPQHYEQLKLCNCHNILDCQV